MGGQTGVGSLPLIGGGPDAVAQANRREKSDEGTQPSRCLRPDAHDTRERHSSERFFFFFGMRNKIFSFTGNLKKKKGLTVQTRGGDQWKRNAVPHFRSLVRSPPRALGGEVRASVLAEAQLLAGGIATDQSGTPTSARSEEFSHAIWKRNRPYEGSCMPSRRDASRDPGWCEFAGGAFKERRSLYCVVHYATLRDIKGNLCSLNWL